jgi:hypothetical protein
VVASLQGSIAMMVAMETKSKCDKIQVKSSFQNRSSDCFPFYLLGLTDARNQFLLRRETYRFMQSKTNALSCPQRPLAILSRHNAFRKNNCFSEAMSNVSLH